MRYLGVLFTGVLLAAGILITGTPMTADAVTSSEVKAFVKEHIAKRVQEGGGVYKLTDERTGKDESVEFVKIRLIRKVTGHGYFTSVIFRVKDEPEKFYYVDFWVKAQDEKLKLVDARIHKYPAKLDGQWVQKSVSPLPWWWAVAQEHPGETAEAKAWEVKAAIHAHVAEQVKEGGGAFKHKDEKTGENLTLEFVKIHNPVQKVKQGEYFACTDFRVQGESQKVYDLDFWVAEQDGKLVVNKTRVHKEPAKEGKAWVQKPRYFFKDDEIVALP